MLVDASAIVAILLREDQFEALERALLPPRAGLTSAMAIWEATVRLAREFPFDTAKGAVEALVRDAKLQIVPIDEGVSALALSAAARFGKGRHPAKLNMGDCFAYACARANSVPLLYVGDDFGQTDIETAFPDGF